MKLGEALSKLKKERGKLARFIQLRKDTFYVQDGKKPRIEADTISKEINQKIDEIRTLKIKIQKTNLRTQIMGDGISLSEAIIKVNDIRSKLASLKQLVEREKRYWLREKDEIELIPQINEMTIEDEIEALEKEKTQLDDRIQVTNWSTNLID